MTDDKQRTEHAKWVLERTLGWIATADVKVGVAMALDTAMFAGLAASYGVSDSSTRTVWAFMAITVACGSLIAAVFCAAMSALPRINGPISSNIYFGRIAEKSLEEYNETFSRLDEGTFLVDLTSQIHRNAEIAAAKHAWVRKSLVWSYLAALPWATSILLMVKR
jgi:hypothetical protein